MSATAPAAEAAHTHTRLTIEELRNFDADATKLILEMQIAGWTGYITNRGHAFMLAPDGTTTASVTRDSLRGRSGRNARAQLTRWVRTQREAEEARTAPSSFGPVRFDEPGMPLRRDGERALPVATLAEMRRHDGFRKFMDDNRWRSEAGQSYVAFVLPLEDGDNPRSWAAFDIAKKHRPVLVAMGSQMDEALAWEKVYDQNSDILVRTTPDTHITEGQDMKVFVCKTCAEQFEVLTDLASHVNNTHPNKSWQCDQCDKPPFNTAGGLNLHKSASHPVTVACPECGRDCMGAGALGVHRRKAHGVLKKSERDKAARVAAANEGVTVTHTEPHEPVVHEPILVRTSIVPSVTDDTDTVTSPSPIEPTGDVLMDYLLASPEGEDAEDLVARMRALLAAPIVAELRRLREDNRMLVEQNDKLSHDNGDLEAKLSIMREALSV
jgi:hypothetical protein